MNKLIKCCMCEQNEVEIFQYGFGMCLECSKKRDKEGNFVLVGFAIVVVIIVILAIIGEIN